MYVRRFSVVQKKSGRVLREWGAKITLRVAMSNPHLSGGKRPDNLLRNSKTDSLLPRHLLRISATDQELARREVP